MESIITTIAICIAIPLVFQIFYFLRAREEKKYKYEKVVRTRMPKAIQWFFGGFFILAFGFNIVGSIFIIKDNAPISTLLILWGVGIIFIFLGALGYCLTRFNYEILYEDKIIVVRCFKKKREVSFNEICYYSYVPGFIGGLIGYDKSGIPVVKSDGGNIGIEELAEKFRQKNITLISNIKSFPDSLPTEQREKYEIFKKKSNLKISGWIFFGFGLMCLLLFAMLLSGAHFEEFQNYSVTGTVESYDFDKKNSTITIKLTGDDNTYFVNNIVYDEVDGELEKQLKENSEITLYIGYTNKWGRPQISQIELNGETYLDMDKAEAAEWGNYKGLRIMAFVILGIAVVLLILWLSFLIVSKIKFVNRINSV